MSKKKEEELQAIKDVSRPAIDAVSMKQPKDQTDEEWHGVKAKAKAEGRNVSDAEYETRYQALLKRYNIKPENYETSSGGAATYYEEGKKDSQSEKQGKAPSEQKKAPTEQKKAPTEQKKAPTEQKKAPTEQKKASSKPTKSKTSTKSNTASKGTKTPPPQSTGRAQTSKTGSNIPPKKEVKEPPKKGNKTHPVGGWKEENQDVNNINNSRAKTMLYNDRVKLKIQKERPKSSSFTRAKTTVASLRNEYQQELIKKHKKEMAGLGTDKPQVKKQKSTESKKPQSKSLSIASLRNEYQQELIKKHKKEMSK